jgi:RNA polymerase sigma-70 factor (ECF subfamily)
MEPDILARLIERHASALVLYARQWCAAAEDVVQEALVKLADQGPEPHNIPAWLFRTVRNGAISAARAEGRRRRHEADAARGRDWFCADAHAPLDAAEAAHALQDLPLEEREVIVAHLWGGLTFEQAGQVAGCSASTAHRRYQAGLAHLREKFEVQSSTFEARPDSKFDDKPGEPCPNMNHSSPTGSKPPCGS